MNLGPHIGNATTALLRSREVLKSFQKFDCISKLGSAFLYGPDCTQLGWCDVKSFGNLAAQGVGVVHYVPVGFVRLAYGSVSQSTGHKIAHNRLSAARRRA